MQVKVIGEFVVAKVHYPGCVNYMGNKTSLYRKEVWEAALEARMLDPHFLEGKLSPIARYEPTPYGWASACLMAKLLATAGL
jgi:hypothetical protein